jgi:hypothetical protein
MAEDLHEYEIEDKNGIVTTVQLSDDDAKNRFPHARKVGAHGKNAEPQGQSQAAQQHTHEQAHNRARK